MADTTVIKGAREAAHKAREGIEQHAPMLEPAAKRLEKHAFPVFLGLTAGSILFSLSLFGRKSKENAIFVGLWAPTLLSLGLFYMLVGPGRDRERED